MGELRFKVRPAELSDLARCLEIDASYVTTQVWQLQEGFQDPLVIEPEDLDTAKSSSPRRSAIVGKAATPKPLTYHMELVPSRLPRPLAVSYPLNEQELLAEWKQTDYLLVAETIEEQVLPPPVSEIAPDIFADESNFAEDERTLDLIPPAIPAEIIGYVGLRVDGPRHLAWLTTGAVQLDYRRQAIGSRLLQEALVWADRNRLRSVLVELQTKNYPAISFFQHNKFFFCGYNNSYYPTREIALFFACRLERFIEN